MDSACEYHSTDCVSVAGDEELILYLISSIFRQEKKCLAANRPLLLNKFNYSVKKRSVKSSLLLLTKQEKCAALADRTHL